MGKIKFSTMGKIKFAVSNYFSFRKTINTACEKSSTSVWHQELHKKAKLFMATFYVAEVHLFHAFVSECIFNLKF